MHQDMNDRMAEAAAEALKNPGEEPDWATSFAEARERIGELENEVLRQGVLNSIREHVIVELRTEIARLLSERAQLQARASRTLAQHFKDVFRGRS